MDLRPDGGYLLQSLLRQTREWVCKKIGDGFDHPRSVSIGFFSDFQLPLIPGVGGGSAVGITGNGQLFIDFSAQAEWGPILNLSVGVQGSYGKNHGDLPFLAPQTDYFTGAQAALRVGAVASGAVTTSDGKSPNFSKSVGRLGAGVAGQEALVLGTNTKIAVTKSVPAMLCGGKGP